VRAQGAVSPQLRSRSVRLADELVFGVRGGVLRCTGVLPPSAPPFSGLTCTACGVGIAASKQSHSTRTVQMVTDPSTAAGS